MTTQFKYVGTILGNFETDETFSLEEVMAAINNCGEQSTSYTYEEIKSNPSDIIEGWWTNLSGIRYRGELCDEQVFEEID